MPGLKWVCRYSSFDKAGRGLRIHQTEGIGYDTAEEAIMAFLKEQKEQHDLESNQ